MRFFVSADFDDASIDRLRASGEVQVGGWGQTAVLMEEDALIEALRGVDVLIVGYDQVTRRVIEESPALKLIASTRGGPEQSVDIEAATERGIPVTYTVGREAIPVAEFAFGLMIGLLRKIALGHVKLVQRQLTGGQQEVAKDIRWGLSKDDPWLALKGHDLYKKTLGLVGIGAVGREVAKRALAFGMEVLAYDPYVRAESLPAGVRLVELYELLRTSDVVSVHARSSPTSIGMLGRRQLALMKPTAVLINTARAAIVEEQALYEAVEQRWIAGVGLDVFHQEPLQENSPLLAAADRVVLTPHIAGSSYEAIPRQSAMVLEQVFRFLRGERPTLVANPKVYETKLAPAIR